MKFEIHFEFRASLRKFQDLNFWDATAILLKMNKNEGPNTGSFIKKACSTMMDGMMILIMVPLLLTMLLPWQQNCRLSHGPRH
jgi:hypothetical protein